MFKVGDEVVCIDAMALFKSDIADTFLKRGQVYRVLGVENLCHVSGIDIGRRIDGPSTSFCHACKKRFVTPPSGAYAAWRFIKLPKVSTETTIAEEVE